MKDFLLIDLRSQADAFWQYVNGWTKQEILLWLSKHGTITPHPTHPDSYWFRSTLRITAFFTLTDEEFYTYWGGHFFHKLIHSH